MRSIFVSLLLTLALFFCGNAAMAQQSTKPVTPVPQHSEDLSVATQASKSGTPQASPEMQALTTALSGEWSLSVKWEPDASMPNGLVNAGEETWRAGPGGYTLLEEEHLRMPQGDAFLLGIVWWNSKAKNLEGMECQNLLPYTCDVKGALNDIVMRWDGKEFVIDEIETSHTGKKSMWHEVWSDITPASFTQTGEFGGKRLFTIHATRITAQNKNDAPTTKGAEQPMLSSAQPAPEMQSLAKALSGKWSTTYEFEPGGPFPSRGTGTAEEVWRTGSGGYVLMEEEHVRGPNKEVFLVAFHWWDSNTHSLRGMLCDNSGPAACDFDSYSNSSLKWDGEEFTIDREFSQNGKKMTWHEVWSGFSSNSFTETGDVGAAGSPLKRVMTIHGTKIAN